LSCSDRRLARAAVSLAALALLGATAGCGSDAAAEAGTPTGTAADATTGRIAEVEWARQCTVDTANHADETAFTTDLDARLTAAGFTHGQWKRWHDALADSPELITQFAEISAPGCPAG
jgi:hypothetical protein